MAVAVAIAIGTATAITTATTIDIARCQGRCMSKCELALPGKLSFMAVTENSAPATLRAMSMVLARGCDGSGGSCIIGVGSAEPSTNGYTVE